MTNSQIKFKNSIILAFIVVIHTLVLYKLCSFSRALETYRDELFYYDLAKSLFFENSTEIQGIPFIFQNTAYSYFLTPFFLISDSVLRLKAIAFVNSFLFSLVIIPTWLICKELKLSEKYSWFVVGIVALWPDMLNAGSFMSENLYWILGATALLFIVKSLNSDRKIWPILAAISTYMVYWCKEVGICFALAYIASLALFILLDFTPKKKENRKKLVLSSALKLGIFIGVFVILHIIFKLFVYSKNPNPYLDSVGTGLLSDTASLRYLMYALLYYTVSVLIVYMVFPLILPFFNLKNDSLMRKVFLFTIILIAGLILVIVVTITMSEDLGNYAPRLHLRYLGPVICTIFPVFYKAISEIENRDKKDSTKNRILLGILPWSVIGIIIFLTYKGTYFGPVTENLTLSYNILVEKLFPSPQAERFPEYSILHYPYAVAISICLLIFLFIGGVLFTNKRTRKHFSVYLLISISLASAFNLYSGEVRLKRGYAVNADSASEMSRINEYFRNNELQSSSIVFLTDHWAYKNSKICDTYFDGTNCYEMSVDDFKNIIYSVSDKYDLSKEKLVIYDVFRGTSSITVDAVDYFIVNNGVSEDLSGLEGIEEIPEFSGGTYTVYKNIDPKTIEVTDESKNELIKYVFAAAGNSIPSEMSGISVCEGDFTWTLGHSLVVPVSVQEEIESVKISIYTKATFNGEQRFIIRQQGEEIVSGVINGVDKLEFNLKPIDGDAGFEIYFPDAASPAELGLSDDPRELALALTKIVISK